MYSQNASRMSGRGRGKGRRSKTCIGRKFKTKLSKEPFIVDSKEPVCFLCLYRRYS